ncbi:hypothetical protein Hypma_002095, partial [Hypsizygus marmoreus]
CYRSTLLFLPPPSAMSTTTETKASAPPEFTILTRVASIPMISSSLETIDGALSKNAYLSSPYFTAKGISTTAYKYTEPLQIRLAPLIIQADEIANKAVDAVESRYPYPFKAKPEEVATLVRERRQSATDYATTTIDKRVKTPAYNVAQGIDQRFSPVVDYFQVTVDRFHPSTAGPSTPPDAKYQYQRALALTKTVKDDLYVYSNEQIKELQAHNALVQRATETAQSISQLASSSITSAQTRIHQLSDNMLAELHKLQSSTAALSSSVINNSTSRVQAQIPPQIQKTYAEVSQDLSSAVSELRNIITTKDITLQEKVHRVGSEVQEHVGPLLESIKKGVSELLARGKAEASEASSDVKSASSQVKVNDIKGKVNGIKGNGNGKQHT